MGQVNLRLQMNLFAVLHLTSQIRKLLFSALTLQDVERVVPLGDIRMNSLRAEQCFARSLATRKSGAELSDATQDAIQICKQADFDLIIVETSGIGQGNSAIIDISDVCIYVMTPEFGAPSQLEKIDMLDFADIIVLNKFDRRGAEDAFEMYESKSGVIGNYGKSRCRVSTSIWNHCRTVQ